MMGLFQNNNSWAVNRRVYGRQRFRSHGYPSNFFVFCGIFLSPRLGHHTPKAYLSIRFETFRLPTGYGHQVLLLNCKYKKHKLISYKLLRWNFHKVNRCRYIDLTYMRITPELVDGNAHNSCDRIVKTILSCALKIFPSGQVKKHRPFWNNELQTLKQIRDDARKKTARFRHIVPFGSAHTVLAYVSIRPNYGNILK